MPYITVLFHLFFRLRRIFSKKKVIISEFEGDKLEGYFSYVLINAIYSE